MTDDNQAHNDDSDHRNDVNRRLAHVWRDSRLGPTVENLRRYILHHGETTLEVGQYRLLHAMIEHGPLPMRALAVAVGANQSSVSRSMQRLENAGLAARTQSTSDLRSFTVQITDEGRRVHTFLVDRAFGLYEDIFAVFTTEERLELASLLERLLKSAETTLADLDPRQQTANDWHQK